MQECENGKSLNYAMQVIVVGNWSPQFYLMKCLITFTSMSIRLGIECKMYNVNRFQQFIILCSDMDSQHLTYLFLDSNAGGANS